MESLFDVDLTDEEFNLITDIALRAATEFDIHGDTTHHTMNLIACHKHGCPLELQRLFDADDFNFLHDIGGIDRHINRETGMLENCFLPRFAA